MAEPIPGVCEVPDAATHDYVLTHTMIRIKDREKSLDFYTRILGMRLARTIDFPEWKFSLFFLQARGNGEPAADTAQTFARPGLLELTYNWGSEDDTAFRPHSGNEEPKGYGHICIAVPDIEAACRRFDELGVTFQKRLGAGGMKEIAFIKDPDGYWIEIVQPDLMDGVIAKATGG
ncbi:lactoylglutathione lyase [Faunimonas sp. B44]|uniref:lactoylglutathione lyase n=1 Tax=Faunimonas sp. B44 TaxID=3461493 RepID=UPI0040447033